MLTTALTPEELATLRQELCAPADSGAVEDAIRDRTRDGRRELGAYFTPDPLVDFVVRGAVRARLSRGEPRWRDDGSPELIVLDPAAGDGRFLSRAADVLAEIAAERGHEPERSREAIVKRCLVGIDRDAEFCRLARCRLPGATIYCAEALLGAPDELPAADVVVGNPPYVRSIRLVESDAALWTALRGRYEATSHGEWDLYAAFLEQALEWTGQLGEIGFVVSSRWLTAKFARRLRKKLADLGAVRALVDFGAAQIFSGATTYASVAFLTRRRAATVEVARLREGAWECGRIDVDSLGETPWRLSVGPSRRLMDKLAAAGPPLGEVARIAKGAGTNADPIYVYDGDSHPDVERELIRICIRGRDVRAFSRPDPGVRIVVPYTRTGTLIPPDELARRFPRATAYFRTARRALESRERGRFRGDDFYRFGRPQNMAYHGSRRPKIVIPDVAHSGRAMLDTRGAMVLDTAYAARPLADDLSPELLLAVLNSRAVKLWLSETGIPLRGNYLRLKTAYLSSLPFPTPSAVTAEIEDRLRLCDGVDAAEIDDLVRQAYGLTLDEWSG